MRQLYCFGFCCDQVTAVIASVEDTLGVPSPEELAETETEEVRRLAEGE